MRGPGQRVLLYDRRAVRYVDAYLHDGMVAGNIDDVERLWKPILDRAVDALRTAGTLTGDALGAVDAQDAHWRWRDKAAHRTSALAWRCFALECGGRTQGLMFADLTGFSRISGGKARELVYVDLLSTAPWNRKRLVPEPEYGGVGRLMLAAAISLSLDEGFGGRIGLHSLPQSEPWYRDTCRMTDLGVDPSGPHQGLHYFEMTEAQATAFLT